jgi:hypothetical protein
MKKKKKKKSLRDIEIALFSPEMGSFNLPAPKHVKITKSKKK